MDNNTEITVDLLTSDINGYSICSDATRKKILSLWAQRMRTFLLRRFDENSKGGGEWKPLKRKRTGKKPARIKKSNKEQQGIKGFFERQSILVNTGILRMALNPQKIKPGAIEEYQVTPDVASVTIGFGGSDVHPPEKGAKKGSGITIAELAVIHHGGTATIPARPILVEPDEKTEKAMIKIAEDMIEKEK